ELVAWMYQAPWQSTWRVMQPGEYTLTATAFNSQGQSTTSTPVHITVRPMNHRLSGRVYDSITNAGIPGVTMDLVSPSNPNIHATTMTDSTGSYLFTDLGATVNDSVVITPTMSGYTFDPPNRSIGYLGYIDWD